MEETDKMYYAGLFDGEGCVSIAKTDRGTYTGYQLVCTVGMTHKPSIERLKEFFGGSISKVKIRNPNARQAWQWTVASDVAYAFLTLIRPYMMIKRDEADVALAFQEHIQNTRKRFGNGKTDPDRDSADEFREQCYDTLRHLKKREWRIGDDNNVIPDTLSIL